MNVNIIAPILAPPGGGNTSYSGLYGMRLRRKGVPLFRGPSGDQHLSSMGHPVELKCFTLLYFT